MLGAILGDIVGSPYEHSSLKRTDFPLFGPASRFIDDTVLTVATADALLHGRSYREAYRDYARQYPHAGYGGSFREWMWRSDDGPYGSWGNGSAMRVSPVGWLARTAEEAVEEAALSSRATHDHPDAVAAAQAVALGIFRLRQGTPRADVRQELASRFGYDLTRPLAVIRRTYAFDVSARGSVPQAIVAFLESGGVESAIRLAVSLGGDADTQAAIAGALAEAEQGGVPETLREEVRRRLPPDLLSVVDAFQARFRAA